ncbi:MAG: sigma-70 family RNA polymerase sigma factor [Polyangiales bacterium]
MTTPVQDKVEGEEPDEVNPSEQKPSKASASHDRAIDRSLIERAAKGDSRAFRELVDRHQRKAHAVAYGVVRNVDDAREVTQDAFMRVYRHLDDFEGQASFSTWLYRIVVNLSIDLIRRRSPRKHLELDDRTELDGAPHELLPFRGDRDPLVSLERGRIVESVQQCLDQLPPYHRTIIVLREVEGLSYEEIAEAMQVPKGTVMSRLFHARRKMQRLLHDLLGDEVPSPQDDRDPEVKP